MKPEDRVPPYSEEAERSVIGSVLLSPDHAMDMCVEKGLVPKSFHVPAHELIYETCCGMWRDGRAIDVLTLDEKLKADGNIRKAGGSQYLLDLIDSTPTAAHSEYYIDIVIQKEILRRVIKCARESEKDCYTGGDAYEVVAKAEQAFYDICGEGGSTQEWVDAVLDTRKRIEEMLSSGGSFAGIPTGFLNMDDVLLGLKSSEMIVIAARPSMGKTALAMNIAENIALGRTADHDAKAVGIFSLEMSMDALVLRMLCSHAEVSTHNLTQGIVTPAQHGHLNQAADVLAKAPLWIDDTGGLDVDSLRARGRRMKKKHGVELIIIDYLQLLHVRGFEKRPRQEEVGAASSSLKAMAKELGIPVVVVSQLSRSLEHDGQRKPRLADLRDSGAIEQDADVVCLLRRPCKLQKDEENQDLTLAVVDIAKHRNGRTGEVRLNFEERFTRFTDRVRGVDPAAKNWEPQDLKQEELKTQEQPVGIET